MEQSRGEPEPSAGEWEVVKDLVYEWETDRPSDLDAWLTLRCSSPSIRGEVERLVRASATSGNFLLHGAAQEHFGVPAAHPVGIGRYRVIQEIGAGGLGVVYAAYDPALERKVAIKVLADKVSGESERRKRLRWDAKAASAAKHPNIVVVHDIGTDNGFDYIVMECVEGQTLGRILAAGAIPVQTALGYALQVADALGAAHSHGVVHRDLKPNNIMVTDEGVVKVLDFGLAKVDQEGAEYTSQPQTIEGHFAGTVAYVSPEQAEGRTVDARGDIFSFGCILFEMLTGKPAFHGGSAVSILGSILHQPAPALRQVAPQLDERFEPIVQRCLAKKPADRFNDIAEVSTRLAELLESNPSPPHLSYRTWKLLSRSAIALAAVAAIAAAVFVVTRNNSIQRYDQFRRTIDSGRLATTPALSKNGNVLAYASDRAGNHNLDLWVQYLDAPTAKRVTTDDADDYSPSFNNLGSAMVYRSEKDGGGLYTISTLGGTPAQLLAPRGRDGRFSPDGARIVYWTGTVGAALHRGCAQIFILKAAGGVPQQLALDFEAAAYPIWSPSGDQVMFLGRKTGEEKGDWWVLQMATNSAHRTGLLQAITRVGAYHPGRVYMPVPSVWLSDNTLLFTAKSNDATNIWSVHVKADGTPSDVPQHWTNGTDVEDFPDGGVDSSGKETAVYTAMKVETALWRIPLNPAGKTTGEPVRVLGGIWGLGSPSTSTDGSKMIYITKQHLRSSIQFANFGIRDPGAASQVVLDDTNRAVLSGDGNTICWGVQAGPIYIMDLRTGAREQICDRCASVSQVNFDGTKAILEGAKNSDDLDLWVRGHAIRHLFRFAHNEWLQAAGRFSPDERWVAFSGWHEGEDSRQIVIAPVSSDGITDPQTVVQLTSDSYTNSEPVWAPDGKRVYFLSDHHGYNCVWARNVDPATGQPQGEAFVVADFHFAGLAVRGPSSFNGTVGLSANKDFLLLTLTETLGNIWSRDGR